jgi:hypothetical protein
MKKKIYILIIATCWSCTNNSDTEKYQNKRDNIIFVKEKIKEIDPREVLISQYARLYIVNDYLLIADARTINKLIYIFDKKNYRYIANVVDKGQGAGEIVNMGFIGVNNSDNVFDVIDHGKQKIFTYSMDSVLSNPLYEPEVKMTMNRIQFPKNYQYVNDTLLIGIMIEPTGNSGFNHVVARINNNTGEIMPMRYKHPEIEKKRVCLAVSAEHGIYVEGYCYHDLMTVYNLNGEPVYNIYGRKWDNRTTNQFGYYEKIAFCNDKIVASYSDGKNRYSNSENSYPTQFLIFNTEGNYIRTLETGYAILDFCYDVDNHRIIMHVDSEFQFVYLDLDGLVEKKSILSSF